MPQSSCLNCRQLHCHHQRHHHHHRQRHQSTPHQAASCFDLHKPTLLHQRSNYGLSWRAVPLLVALLFLAEFPLSSPFVVPNELPSILSLVYSNIPPIKKGTDSRLGFGFRLGEHADFQVLVELGPQKNTRPIGDQDNNDGSSFNKRQVNKSQQHAVQREVAKSSEERPANTWLEKWSNQANQATNSKKKVPAKAKPSKKPVVAKQVPRPLMATSQQQMAPQAIQQLQMLYQMATSSTSSTSTTTESPPDISTSTTSTTSAPVFVVTPSSYLSEKLELLKAPVNAEELQALLQKPQGPSKTEITKELMDVSLDE